MVFVYYLTLTSHVERLSLFFHITVAEHWVSTLLLFFTFAFIGGSVEYFHMVEGATVFAELFILLSLPTDLYAFAVDVGFFYLRELPICSQGG